MHRSPRAPLGALLLLAGLCPPAPAAAPITPRMAKARALADEFHSRLRFAFQGRSEEDRQALEQLLRSGGLGPIVQAWSESRLGIVGTLPDEAPDPDTTLEEVLKVADRFVRREIQGHNWDRGRATREGDTWTVRYRTKGYSGVRATVLVDAKTGKPRLK